MKLRYCIIIFLFIIIIISLTKYNYVEKYENNNILFISPEETFQKIVDSNYFNKFTKKDMEIRKCKDINNCKEIYKKNIINFTDKQKSILINLISKVDNILKKYKAFYNIPWKFSLVNNNIENGFPHTHLDIIILSTIFFNKPSNMQLSTLIHEKIHIYQKLNKSKTEKFYNSYNFKKKYKNTSELRRTNPDLDDFVWEYNNISFYSEYKKNSTNLGDIEIKLQNLNNNNNLDKNFSIDDFKDNPNIYEHPDELFAYFLTDKIVNDNFDKNDKKLINYITN